MGEFEAVGEAVTGGLLGRAAEPDAGDTGADGHTHERNCLNCATPLQGDYCHSCGQKAHVHRTLRAFGHDLLHGALHFEGKIWRTLPMLVWKPGELTRRYIEGERARFVSPVALFLFAVFLMFAVMGLTGGLNGTSGQLQADLASEIAEARGKVTELEAERARAVSEQRPTSDIDDRLNEKRAEIAGMQKVRFGPAAVAEIDAGGAPGWLSGFVDKTKANPELVFYKLKTNAYKFSWALIPISVPFVWLLFPFSRRFRVYDHTVFVTYSLCFMMLLLIFVSLLGLVGLSAGWIALILTVAVPLHIYKQLRGTYGCSRFGAFARVWILLFAALVVLSIYSVLLFFIGALD